MAFPPRFLDELRARLTLSTIIGRRIKLTRAGREYKACCPFHNEKTPSFFVNDEKGFYHCFGCGAHGDIISFEMEQGNLSFPDAVERLAAEAGLEVPRETPREREAAQKRAGVLEVLETACTFFEQQLHMPVGKDGLAYLQRRGLSAETIARFRLGWAPTAGALKSALARQTIDEGQLIEAGLLKASDSADRPAYDYFRERVTFPITDRRGRVIAFGARTLGDGQPKYLNSPETPVFQKGLVLYGLAQARDAVGAAGEIIVAEGYMDVIALAAAGFSQTVAPLGTALTEPQIEDLWRMVDEPILCFDGDAAGQRAALRAADRALPLLRPGKSLRFALLPAGQDPDDLLRAQGPRAMRGILDAARPLLEVLWQRLREGRTLDTPERRAALEAAVEEQCRAIADRTVQGHYRQALRDKLWSLWRASRAASSSPRNRQGRNTGGFGSLPALPAPGGPVGVGQGLTPDSAYLLHCKILLLTVITHPRLYEQVAERLGSLHFNDAALDRLRERVLFLLDHAPSLDFEALCNQLRSDGYSADLDSLLTSHVFAHAAFSRPATTDAEARHGWDHTFARMQRDRVRADYEEKLKVALDTASPQDYAALMTRQARDLRPGNGEEQD